MPDVNVNGMPTHGAHLFLPRPVDLSGGDGFFRQLYQQNRKLYANSSQAFSLPPWGPSRFPLGGHRRHAADLDSECGYPTEGELSASWYKQAYSRWGIASRVVNIWPDECWAEYPDVYETPDPGETKFEKDWNEIVLRCKLYHYLHRADRLSRIGQFCALFLGLDDGGRLDQAPVGINPDTGERMSGFSRKYKLNFVRAFDQTLVRVSNSDKNRYSPRYGEPRRYYIQFSANAVGGPGFDAATTDMPTIENRVHWTRIIHVADAELKQSSEIYAVPAMMPVANYLHDVRKVAGSSAEMFYKGGFPGYAFQTNPDLGSGDTEIQAADLREQIELYQNNLQRYLFNIGGTWNSLQPQVANPDKHLEWYVKLVCLAINVPARIFMGSEAGHLASQKDDDAWRTRCRGRQVRYLEPFLVRPLVERLSILGCVPKPKKVICDWKDLRALSEKDRVDIALKKTQALMQYVSGNVEQKFPFNLFLSMVLNLTEDQVEAVEGELAKNPPDEPMEMKLARMTMQAKLQQAKQQKSMGGIRKGNAPKAAAGRPAGRVQGNPKSASKPGSAGRRAKVNSRRK